MSDADELAMKPLKVQWLTPPILAESIGTFSALQPDGKVYTNEISARSLPEVRVCVRIYVHGESPAEPPPHAAWEELIHD